jgi:histidinol-phosphate/aromatic aminotransferase/cobyric acid decarboxylase-like protein
MTTTLAMLEAKPEDRTHVRQALEQMVHDSATLDPELRQYAVYESPERPNVFFVQQEIPAVDEELELMVAQRLMEVGTALREQLNGPIQLEHLRLVASTPTG